VATIHHGLPLERMPFSPTPGLYLALVGRMSSEKGIVESIQVARACGIPLRIAAKLREEDEQAYFESVVQPALGEDVEYLGELAPERRDPLLAGARATMMLGAWPEPFGLSMVEAMVSGTPTIAFRQGSAPELIDDGRTGFVVDTIDDMVDAVRNISLIDPARCSLFARNRFSPDVMVEEYLRMYARVLDRHALQPAEAVAYGALLHRAFAAQAPLDRILPRGLVHRAGHELGFDPRAMARDLVARQWSRVYALVRSATSRPRGAAARRRPGSRR